MNTQQTVKEKAYTLALSTFLSNYPLDEHPQIVFDRLGELIESGDVMVWLPFENSDIMELSHNIEILADHAISLFGDN